MNEESQTHTHTHTLPSAQSPGAAGPSESTSKTTSSTVMNPTDTQLSFH